MDDATKAVALFAIAWAGKFGRELLRDRKAKRERKEREKRAQLEREEQRQKLNSALLQLDLRMGLVERVATEAAEHSASLNRKKWREQHPGQETPDPTETPIEPRTNWRDKKP